MAESVEKSLIFKLTSAIIVTAGAVATCITYFYENYRVPMKVLEVTLEYKNVAETSTKTQKEINKIKAAHLETQKKLTETELQIGELNERIISQNLTIQKLHLANLFQANFYPVGYGRPRIGDSVDELKALYNAKDVHWDSESEWKVKVGIPDGYFESIEYDYDEKTRVINAVMFAAAPSTEKTLVSLISDIGGPPVKSKRGEIYRWNVGNGQSGYLVSHRLWMIMGEGMEPLLWREP